MPAGLFASSFCRSFAAFLLASSALVAQQDMGVITGLVTDASGAAVPSARVTVTNIETNEVRIVESSATGSYTVGPLRIGLYQVAVEHAGFKRAVVSNLRVSAQDRVRADVELTVGQMAESVSVTAETPLLRAETSSLDYVVGQREMRELPLNGRNFQQLAWLTAGVIPSTRSRDRESGFNAHGQPMTQNSFIIDGIDNNNNVMGMQDRKMQVVAPSLDAVAEFKVQTSNFSAEFGRNSGAVMIVNIKSGTNQFRGTAYDYLRNDATDARDMFNYVDRTGDGRADPEVLKQNQFGATFGGPIVKDKTFFFASYEGRIERRSQTDTAIVPIEVSEHHPEVHEHTHDSPPALGERLAEELLGQFSSVFTAQRLLHLDELLNDDHADVSPDRQRRWESIRTARTADRHLGLALVSVLSLWLAASPAGCPLTIRRGTRST